MEKGINLTPYPVGLSHLGLLNLKTNKTGINVELLYITASDPYYEKVDETYAYILWKGAVKVEKNEKIEIYESGKYEHFPIIIVEENSIITFSSLTQTSSLVRLKCHKPRINFEKGSSEWKLIQPLHPLFSTESLYVYEFTLAPGHWNDFSLEVEEESVWLFNFNPDNGFGMVTDETEAELVFDNTALKLNENSKLFLVSAPGYFEKGIICTTKQISI